jgi:hypothetical protein
VCESLCRESGWVGQAVVAAILVARTLYVQWRNRQLKTEKAILQTEVKTLSLRPPQPVTLQLAPHPSLASLFPLPAHPSEGADVVADEIETQTGRRKEDPPRQ